MKKLLIFLTIIFSFSCKKNETTPANNAPANSYPTFKKGKITINVQSNYKYPYVAIENGQATIKSINHSPSTYTTLAPLTCSMLLTTKGVYRVYILTQNVAAYKSDTFTLWHNEQVFMNDSIPVLITTKDAVQSEFYFNIQ